MENQGTFYFLAIYKFVQVHFRDYQTSLYPSFLFATCLQFSILNSDNSLAILSLRRFVFGARLLTKSVDHYCLCWSSYSTTSVVTELIEKFGNFYPACTRPDVILKLTKTLLEIEHVFSRTEPHIHTFRSLGHSDFLLMITKMYKKSNTCMY